MLNLVPVSSGMIAFAITLEIQPYLTVMTKTKIKTRTRIFSMRPPSQYRSRHCDLIIPLPQVIKVYCP